MKSGGQTTRRGQYLTVWRKQADGAWKVVYDSGSNF
jgi:ketosteroid isomerase-like protein